MLSRHAVSSCICKTFLWKCYHLVPVTRQMWLTRSFWRLSLPRSKAFMQPPSYHRRPRLPPESLFRLWGSLPSHHYSGVPSQIYPMLLHHGAHQATQAFHGTRNVSNTFCLDCITVLWDLICITIYSDDSTVLLRCSNILLLIKKCRETWPLTRTLKHD